MAEERKRKNATESTALVLSTGAGLYVKNKAEYFSYETLTSRKDTVL